MSHQYYIYIMTNDKCDTLYTGVTGNLVKRVYEHKNKMGGGFTSRYNLTRLVYFEAAEDAYAAITREKQIKAGSRKSKLQLVNRRNPSWHDLSNLFMEP